MEQNGRYDDSNIMYNKRNCFNDPAFESSGWVGVVGMWVTYQLPISSSLGLDQLKQYMATICNSLEIHEKLFGNIKIQWIDGFQMHWSSDGS